MKKLIASMAVGVLTGGMLLAPSAQAAPDYLFPIPPAWCPGGGVQTPWGGYCDGANYPDGTRWQSVNGMGFWGPLTCVIHTGQPAPPVAPPNGCGRG